MMFPHLSNKEIILASKSPRRQTLFKELGLDFKVEVREVEEVYPPELAGREVPVFLAALKSEAFGELADNQLLVTSDTVVVLDGKVIEKPKDAKDAKRMLKQLSGKTHKVFTGVCLRDGQKRSSFSSKTEVEFKELSNKEIQYYVEQFQPFDKAGSYGIQEWLGYIGIKGINGCYYNVMGLPLSKLYKELMEW